MMGTLVPAEARLLITPPRGARRQGAGPKHRDGRPRGRTGPVLARRALGRCEAISTPASSRCAGHLPRSRCSFLSMTADRCTNSAETAVSINRPARRSERSSVRGSKTRAGAASETTVSVAHARCAPLAEIVVSNLDISKDTPHVSTQPYTTFDHNPKRQKS